MPWIRSTYVPKPTAAGVKSKRIYSSNLDQEMIARLTGYWGEFEEMNRYWSLQRHVDMDLMSMNSGGAVSPQHELDYEWRQATGFPTWPDRLREVRPAEPYSPLLKLREGPPDSYFIRVDDLGTDDPLDGDQRNSYEIDYPIAPPSIAKSPSPVLDDAPVLYKVYDGQVTGLKSYGAFALLHGVRGKVTGMIFTRYIGGSEISCAADVLSMYQNVKTKVVKILPNGKIDLSMKGIDQHTGEDTTPAVDDAPIPGKIYDGTVAAFSTFGAFVKLEGVKGVVEGLVHKTRMAHSTIDVPSQFLKRLQHVKVKVLKVENDDRKGKDRVGLSMKDIDQATGEESVAAAESQKNASRSGTASTVGSTMDLSSNSGHPPPEEDEALILYKIYEGHVKSIPHPAYGAFVEIYGVKGRPQGLVHQTRVSNEAARKVTDVVKRLQRVRVRVVKIDGNKIDLSMKGVDQTTGEGLASELQSVRYEVPNQGANQKVGATPMALMSLCDTPAQLVGDMDEKPVMDKIYNATVRSIHDFGIFVELDNVKANPDGMVPAKDLKTYYVRHPSDVVQPYQKVKVKVITIRPNGKIDLSMAAVDQTTGEDLSGGDVEPGQILGGGEVGRKRPALGDLQKRATRRRLNDDGKSDGSLPY